jgi:L-threonylcarbamoyladenylate synthase
MMCAKLEQAEKIVQIPDEARKIAEAFLPGALTLILPLQPDADRLYTNGKDSAALRIPDAPFLLQVMEQLDCPLLVTSANISGMPAALTTAQALDALKEIDGIVDGECEAKQASTIIDCTKTSVTLVRQGPVSFEQICRVLGDKTTELS